MINKFSNNHEMEQGQIEKCRQEHKERESQSQCKRAKE